MTSIKANHARITRLWLKTDQHWRAVTLQGISEDVHNYIRFQTAMLAALSPHVTDEEWDLALKVAEDALRILRPQ